MTDLERELEWRESDYLGNLRRLTAHLMRLARGSGDADDTVRALTKTHDALIEFCRVAAPAGVTIPFEGMREVLKLPQEMNLDTVVSGALQYAASTLTGNNLQKARGSDEMLLGMRMHFRMDP